MQVPRPTRPLAALLVAVVVLGAAGTGQAAPDGYWELARVELSKPPLERDTVKLQPSTRSGSFVVRASFHQRHTGKHVDDWTAAWRWTPMPRALLPGRDYSFELSQTIVYQPKVDIGHQRCISGGRIQRPSGDDWPEGGVLDAADGTRGLFHMSRMPEQKPQAFEPRVKIPDGREGGRFAIAIIIWHSGGLPPWIWRHVYEWRGGRAPADPSAVVPTAQEWTRGHAPADVRQDRPDLRDPGARDPGTRDPRTQRDDPSGPGRDVRDRSGMTLEADRRSVAAGGAVAVPVWLRNGRDLGNLNFEITYDPAVVRPTGKAVRGNLLDRALFESNPGERARMRIGFAARTGVSGNGTIAQVRWEAVGRPGQRSPLTLTVTRADAIRGGQVTVATIHGEIEILTSGGLKRGDANGNDRLDAGDALSALKMSVKLIPEDLVCDMDEDRTVTSNDARLILQRVVERP